MAKSDETVTNTYWYNSEETLHHPHQRRKQHSLKSAVVGSAMVGPRLRVSGRTAESGFPAPFFRAWPLGSSLAPFYCLEPYSR